MDESTINTIGMIITYLLIYGTCIFREFTKDKLTKAIATALVILLAVSAIKLGLSSIIKTNLTTNNSTLEVYHENYSN